MNSNHDICNPSLELSAHHNMFKLYRRDPHLDDGRTYLWPRWVSCPNPCSLNAKSNSSSAPRIEVASPRWPILAIKISDVTSSANIYENPASAPQSHIYVYATLVDRINVVMKYVADQSMNSRVFPPC